MALNAYLRLKGAAEGDIRGWVTQKGREGRIALDLGRRGITATDDWLAGP